MLMDWEVKEKMHELKCRKNKSVKGIEEMFWKR